MAKGPGGIPQICPSSLVDRHNEAAIYLFSYTPWSFRSYIMGGIELQTLPQSVCSGLLGTLYGNLCLQLSSLVISQHNEKAFLQYGIVGVLFL